MDAQDRLTSGARTAPGRFAVIASAALAFAALYALASGIAAVWRYGWLDLFADAFRHYATYLVLPFPAEILSADNGHRPVLPALLRVAELEFMHGDHRLQWAVGLALATASVLAGWRIVLRDERTDAVARAAAMLALSLAVFWLANGRMLLHPIESVQTYLVLLALIGGAASATRFLRTQRRRWLAAALGCAFVATFSFGTGLVAFPALAVTLLAARAPLAAVGTLLAAMAATLALYVALPGGATVSAVLTVAPWHNLQVAAQWLASPVAALLSPPLAPGTGSLLPIAPRIAPAGELPSLAAAIGLGAMVALAVATLRIRRRGTAGDTELLALALAWFALGASLLVGLARLAYFEAHPAELFAARYMPWPCLLWAALALLALGAPCDSAYRHVPLAAAIIAAVAAIALAHNPFYEVWGRHVQANIRHGTCAILADLWSTPRMQGETTTADVVAAVPLLRKHRAAMFAHPAALRLGTVLHEAPAELVGSAPAVTAVPFVSDAGTAALDLRAALPEDYPVDDAPLWLITDAARIVVGCAHPSPLDADDAIAGVARLPRDGVLLAFPWTEAGPQRGLRLDVAAR